MPIIDGTISITDGFAPIIDGFAPITDRSIPIRMSRRIGGWRRGTAGRMHSSPQQSSRAYVGWAKAPCAVPIIDGTISIIDGTISIINGFAPIIDRSMPIRMSRRNRGLAAGNRWQDAFKPPAVKRNLCRMGKGAPRRAHHRWNHLHHRWNHIHHRWVCAHHRWVCAHHR